MSTEVTDQPPVPTAMSEAERAAAFRRAEPKVPRNFVPIILAEDAGTRETCKIVVLRNIWRHRSVKCRATFRSRLHSAVTDTLQRFGRSECSRLRGMRAQPAQPGWLRPRGISANLLRMRCLCSCRLAATVPDLEQPHVLVSGGGR